MSAAVVAAALAVVLQPFGSSDFLMSDGSRYVARGDYQAASIEVLDTETRRWRTFAKRPGCGPIEMEDTRTMWSGRLLLQCEPSPPAPHPLPGRAALTARPHAGRPPTLPTYVMSLPTGTTRRLHGGRWKYLEVGAWWARAVDDRTYVSLRTGRRVHTRDRWPRDLDDPALGRVRPCRRFAPMFLAVWDPGPPPTWEGRYWARELAGGRLSLQRCDGHDRELARRGATGVSLSAGLVTWRRGTTAFAYDIRTRRRSVFRLPDVAADYPCRQSGLPEGSLIHTRRALIWASIERFADAACTQPARYAGFKAALRRHRPPAAAGHSGT